MSLPAAVHDARGAHPFDVPGTLEHVLLNYPVNNQQSWMALAERSGASPAVLDRVIGLLGCYWPGWQQCADVARTICMDTVHLLHHQPNLPAEQLLATAHRLGEWLGHLDTAPEADPGRVVRAFLRHAEVTDAVVVALLGRTYPRTGRDSSGRAGSARQQVFSSIAAAHHPVAAAAALNSIGAVGPVLLVKPLLERTAALRMEAHDAGVDVQALSVVILRLAETWSVWTGDAGRLLATAIRVVS